MGSRYFAGMLEELDAEYEFHHDATANKLYWAPPASLLQGAGEGEGEGDGEGSPPTELVVPTLTRLIEVVGRDAMHPATNITISGLTLRHTVRLNPSHPSCGEPFHVV
jgi:hypothetical protein